MGYCNMQCEHGACAFVLGWCCGCLACFYMFDQLIGSASSSHSVRSDTIWVCLLRATVGTLLIFVPVDVCACWLRISVCAVCIAAAQTCLLLRADCTPMFDKITQGWGLLGAGRCSVVKQWRTPCDALWRCTAAGSMQRTRSHTARPTARVKTASSIAILGSCMACPL